MIIDGARGASVRWKSFYFLSPTTGFSWRRLFATLLAENQSVFLHIAIGLLSSSGSKQPRPGVDVIVGLVFFVLSLWVWFMTPSLVRLMLGGKAGDVQAALFEFEGYLNAPTVERAIFGGNFDRLGWSSNGSSLSRSSVNKDGERLGTDPYLNDIRVQKKVERIKRGGVTPGGMREAGPTVV